LFETCLNITQRTTPARPEAQCFLKNFGTYEH